MGEGEVEGDFLTTHYSLYFQDRLIKEEPGA